MSFTIVSGYATEHAALLPAMMTAAVAAVANRYAGANPRYATVLAGEVLPPVYRKPTTEVSKGGMRVYMGTSGFQGAGDEARLQEITESLGRTPTPEEIPKIKGVTPKEGERLAALQEAINDGRSPTEETDKVHGRLRKLFGG